MSAVGERPRGRPAADAPGGSPGAPAQDPRAQGEEAGGLGGHQPGRAEHARHLPRGVRRPALHAAFRERGSSHGEGRQGDAPAAQRAGDAARPATEAAVAPSGAAPGETRQARG